MASFSMWPSIQTPAPCLLTMMPPTDLPTTTCNFGFVSISAANSLARWRCNTSYKDGNEGSAHDELPLARWKEKSFKLYKGSRQYEEPLSHMIDKVKAMLSSMGDGEISVSAYDTAWVALVRQIDGNGGPQFPSSIEWIASNQLQDGSWGDADIFSAHDRMINTLACVIALISWKLYPEHCQKGLVFLRENMWRIGEEDATLMPIGFEITFPSLMEIAQEMGLELPYSDPALLGTYEKRNLKLQRIPREVLHQKPTSLLHSLEGLANLGWGRLLKLQCVDGSFLFSPASTAHALEQTGDQKCLQYLEKIVSKFNGGVPNVYPVDLFERMWAADRLLRLGIARHFELEINECIAYLHQYWTEVGICWARNSAVQDVDDTAMGFRLLRLHGYDVSPDVFKNFEKDGEFFCFVGQAEQAVTGMFNLYRASQVMFPGEEILDRARRFTYKYLREKKAANQITDKWIIAKDLPGEVEYGLDFSWYASLPRVEARIYLQQYGGARDIWIGKTFYRMFFVSNDLYLKLAMLDFNHCQSVHQLEWMCLQSWYEASGLGAYGVSVKSMLRFYFLAAASIYEPERMAERLGWARSAIIAEAISSYLGSDEGSGEKWQEFVDKFLNKCRRSKLEVTRDGLVGTLDEMITRLSASHHHHHLRQAWGEWLLTGRMDRFDTGLLLVKTIEVYGERYDDLSVYNRLSELTSSICLRLSCPKIKGDDNGTTADKAIDLDMQELMWCVFQSSDGLSSLTKQTFFNVAKSYYYSAYCPATTLEEHIELVLFEQVI